MLVPTIDPLRWTAGVRTALADSLRSRVVGPDARARSAQIMQAAGPRWFGDDRPIRVVHSDAAMFVGGLRALLLQSLHPLAMAGVAQHSDYRRDPWGRLQRTADFLAATTFGPAVEAQLAVDRVRQVHTRVNGLARDGRPYSAGDPHLLEWVHVVEVDSFLAAHGRFGGQPLDQAQRDAYVADMAVIAAALGVDDPPQTQAEVAARLRGFRPELRSTRESRDATRYLMFEPPLPVPARAAYGLLVAAAVSTLPAWSRPLLLVPYLPVTERLVVRPLGDGITRAFRWAMTAPAG
jgi:uncharacterized protein (DUF2236 family)